MSSSLCEGKAYKNTLQTAKYNVGYNMNLCYKKVPTSVGPMLVEWILSGSNTWLRREQELQALKGHIIYFACKRSYLQIQDLQKHKQMEKDAKVAKMGRELEKVHQGTFLWDNVMSKKKWAKEVTSRGTKGATEKRD